MVGHIGVITHSFLLYFETSLQKLRIVIGNLLTISMLIESSSECTSKTGK